MPYESRRRRQRGSPANPQPTQRRGSRSAANPAPAAPRRRGGLRLADDKLRAGYSKVVHFDVPIAGGREIISIDRRGERPESGRMPAGGLTVFVALGIDGRYSTDSLRGRFDTIDELLHAFGACWPSPCAIPPPSEEQKHDLDGLQHLPFHASSYGLPDTQYAPTTAAQAQSFPLYASTSTRYAPSSTQAPLYAPTSTRYAPSSTQARSYAPTSATQASPYAPVFTPMSAPVFAPTSEHAPPPTPYAHMSKMMAKYFPARPPPAFSPTLCKEQHMDQRASAHTLQKLDVLSLEDSNNGPPGCRLSSSPIWNRTVFDWGITFYTTRDRTGSFRTYPDVGGPFQSLDEVNSAIDRYLIDHQDPTMCAGLSQVDVIIKHVRYYPDGTKKRGSEVKDKRRDKYYQLARALVDKYNDHHNLFGDLAYEVKDFLHGKPLWEDYYIHWTYFHMNFTAKTKGSYGVDTGNLFFAEVAYTRGDNGLTVNSCCILEPSDHGLCYGCGADMKHPNDGNAYACGRRNISYRFQNGAPQLPPGYFEDRYYEDSDEEVERLRSQFKEDEEEFKPLLMPLEV